MSIEKHSDQDNLEKGIIAKMSQKVTLPGHGGVTTIQRKEPATNTIPPALQHALIRSMAMFQQHNIASVMECSEAAKIIKQKWQAGQGADPIEALCQLRSSTGEIDEEVANQIASEVLYAVAVKPVYVSFAHRLVMPSSFYGKYPEMTYMCKLMKVPVTFNEDTDVIGLTSFNPLSVNILSDIFVDEVKAVRGIKPLISVSIMNHANWDEMYKKHFKQGVAV